MFQKKANKGKTNKEANTQFSVTLTKKKRKALFLASITVLKENRVTTSLFKAFNGQNHESCDNTKMVTNISKTHKNQIHTTSHNT